MKKILSLVFLIFFPITFFFLWNNKGIKSNLPFSNSNESKISTQSNLAIKKSLFVPYWTLNNTNGVADFSELIYFGIEGNKNGINKNDLGYENISIFTKEFKSKKKILVVRLLNNQDNLEILKNKNLQNKTIAESINTAKENGFNGIILDLEVSALPFTSLINRITAFSKEFYNKSKEENLSYSVAIYGDNYYRVRPFEPKDLAKYADRIYIMSYDFHKAGGGPGPTFPFKGVETFGYDFQAMIKDFTRDVPREKLIIIYGLFGYDWVVNEKNESTSVATAITYSEVKNKFLNSCSLKDCNVEMGKDSGGIKISYSDEGKRHIIWVEDLSFLESKNEHLLKNGINKISFWAHSYF